jgi:ribonuclease I
VAQDRFTADSLVLLGNFTTHAQARARGNDYNCDGHLRHSFNWHGLWPQALSGGLQVEQGMTATNNTVALFRASDNVPEN